MRIKKIKSVQSWLPYDKILQNGIIKLKNNTLIKIVKIEPINYNLKSELEKEAILNSYKRLIKSCNFNLQILIQSKKEDLSKHIKILEQNNFYPEIKEKYIEYINFLNKEQKSSNKNFFIILSEKTQEEKNLQNIAIQNLQEKYFKIKELLARCGNVATEYTNEKETIRILYSFFNTKIFLNKKEI